MRTAFATSTSDSNSDSMTVRDNYTFVVQDSEQVICFLVLYFSGGSRGVKGVSIKTSY